MTPPALRRTGDAHGRPAAGIAVAGRRLTRQIDTLYPGCFALVMATGIIPTPSMSKACGISDALFDINVAVYAWLIAPTAARLVRAPRALADLVSPQPTFAFFTLVAATDVLGWHPVARAWRARAVAVDRRARPVAGADLSLLRRTDLQHAHGANVVNGGWLIAIVGTESPVPDAVAPLAGGAGPLIFVPIHMLWGSASACTEFHRAAQRVLTDVAPDDIAAVGGDGRPRSPPMRGRR